MNATALPPPQVLTPPEMAFVRAWAEGLDLLLAWRQYLGHEGAGSDLKAARAALQRHLALLRSVARIHGRPDLANLLRRDPAAVVDPARAQPTLDEFRAQQPPDFYSEHELLALYQENHDQAQAGRAPRRRQRLRARLLAAMQTLDGLALPAPRPGDPVRAWLEEALAKRLAAVNIHRLADLQAWITAKGPHWHRPIPRLGAVGAAQVVAWLVKHRSSLGALPAQATLVTAPSPAGAPAAAAAPPAARSSAQAAPPHAKGMAPLERLAMQPAAGPAAAVPQDCRINAHNDLDAVLAWLALRRPGSATWRAYRKAAERWLLWAQLERRQPLGQLGADDCAAFCAFLANPGKGWTAARNTPRAQAAWRPFEAALAPRSVAMTVSLVRALCAWLADQRYLPSNPWQAPATASPAGRTAAQAIGATRRPLRALSAGQWAQLQAWADRLPASLASARVQCLLAVAGSTGMRLSELAQATLAWLHPTPTPSILIHGKQQQARCVPLTRPAVAALRRYLAARNLPTDLSRLPAHAPLVARLHGERALSATRLYEVVGEAFADAAQALAQQDGAAAQALRQASTHWLRHTFALQSARRGAPAAELQALLGHKRAATTRIYRRTAAEQSSTG